MTKFIRLILLILGVVITTECVFLFYLLKINFGTVVPFMIGIIFLGHAIFWQSIQQTINTKWQLKVAWKACWTIFTIWLASFVIFINCILTQINEQQAVDKIDAIIVLGAGVNGDNPTPALLSRLNKAVTVFKKHPEAMIITTGGVGMGRTRSESSVMAGYLIKQNIDADKILLEEKSTSTEKNLIYSKPLLLELETDLDNKSNDILDNKTTHDTQFINLSVAIVTNDFHTVRAKAIAKKLGFKNVTTIASETPLKMRANSWFREYFAFLSGWLFREY